MTGHEKAMVAVITILALKLLGFLRWLPWWVLFAVLLIVGISK